MIDVKIKIKIKKKTMKYFIRKNVYLFLRFMVEDTRYKNEKIRF